MRLPEDELSFSFETFRIMFMQTHNLVLWTVPLTLAALLRVITAKVRHQLVFPACKSQLASFRPSFWLSPAGRFHHDTRDILHCRPWCTA